MTRPVVGVIAEYNPFHNGHALHIGRIREKLPGAVVVCVMSGHVTQRGDLAICRKQARAAMAIRGGADLALELPALYACSAAEGFARAGVSLLAATGVVTYLSFGSEIGRLDLLDHAARTLDGQAFISAQDAVLKQGLSYPAARQKALATLEPASAAALDGPNDILGVEYLRALRYLGSDITPLVIPREGAFHDAAYDDINGPAGRLASASYIRERWLDGRDAHGFIPDETRTLWEFECAAGRAPVSLISCESALLAALRRMCAEDFKALPDVSEGLEYRLARAASRAISLEEFYTLVKTKRYTHARIRRVALRAYMDLPRSSTAAPSYLRVLAANQTGLILLRDIKKKTALPILTKPAHVRRMGKTALGCFIHEARVTDLYALCYPERTQWIGGQEWKVDPAIIGDNNG